MKKLILLLFLFMVISCSVDKNDGYGYNANTEIPVTTQNESSSNVQKKSGGWRDKYEKRVMNLYDANGENWYSVKAFKGTYDGVEFYVFINNDAMSVIPVSMCK